MASRTAAARRRAKAEVKVKYAGQRSDLQSLVSEAASDYKKDLIAADAAARSGAHFARVAKPQVKKVYGAATDTLAGATADVGAAFSKLGAAADPFRAVTAREQAGEAGRVAAAKADALNRLTEREQSSVAGGVFAQQAAKTKYRDTISDLQQKLHAINDRAGADVVSTMGNILEKDAQRHATRSNIRLSHELAQSSTISEGPFAGYTKTQVAGMSTGRKKQLIDASKKKPKKTGSATGGGASTAELKGFQSDFEKALRHAKELKSGAIDPTTKKPIKLSRPQVANMLIKGQRGDVDKDIPDIPSIKDQIALSAALDMAFLGYVSADTARKIHRQRGVKVAELSSAVSQTSRNKRTADQSGPHGGMWY